MLLKLPIPIFNGDVSHPEIEIDRPSAGLIADVKKASETDRYNAIAMFIAGSTKSIGEIVDRGQIKMLCRKMPFRSAEYAVVQIMLLLDSDDGVEGVYDCPRCHHRIISEKVEEGEEIISDTRDHIRDLPVTYTVEQIIHIALSEYVEVVNASTKNTVAIMQEFDIEHPTMEHCMKAFRSYGTTDEMRLQIGIYVEAVKSVDGEAATASWRNLYGMPLFLQIKNPKDFNAIKNKIEEPGMARRVKKVCPSCGKTWNPVVNTSNFFAFGVEQ